VLLIPKQHSNNEAAYYKFLYDMAIRHVFVRDYLSQSFTISEYAPDIWGITLVSTTSRLVVT
jgi:hypothetical protein